MRIHIYYIIGIGILYSIGCRQKPVKQSSKAVDSTVFAKPAAMKSAVKAGADVIDYDGNHYHTIIIGEQTWMAQNLKVTHYNNGEPILQVTGNKQWSRLTSDAYCIYDNSANNAEQYGLLYNWHAVTNAHKLAPKGWHIPTQEEWKTLIANLGGNLTAGSRMLATGVNYWEAPNNTATNESGFGALPAGDRNNNGVYNNKGFSATWWSATGETQTDFATNYSIISNSMAITEDVDDRVSGMSVRCVRDE